MKIQITGAILLCLTVFLNGCGKSSNSSDPNVQNQVNRPGGVLEPELAPWEIHFQSQCPEDVAPDHCLGRYGFSVLSDGTYEVGPGPHGQKFHGLLDAGAMKKITQIIREEVLSFQTSRNCGKEESAIVTYDNQQSTSCHPKVTDQMKRFVSQYYPDSFPNPCVDASSDLDKLYESTLTCERDEDCAFLNSDFLPLDPLRGDKRPIAIDDCTYIEPLAVANSFKAVSLQRELLIARTHVEEICGDHLSKPSCSGASFTSSTGNNPLCFEHRCQLRTVR